MRCGEVMDTQTESLRPSAFLGLRWAFLFTAALATISAGAPPPLAIVAVGTLLASGLAAHAFPTRELVRPRHVACLIAADSVLPSLALGWAPAAGPSVLVALLTAAVAAVALRKGRRSSAAWVLGLSVAVASLPAFSDAALLLSAAFLLRYPLVVAASLWALALASEASRSLWALESARRESDELRTLLEITDAVTGSLDVRHVMRLIVERVGDVVRAQRCSILLVDEEVRNCFVVAANDDPDVDMLEVDLDKYPEIRHAIETREPVVVRDVASDPLVAPVREQLLRLGYRSVVVLPLVFGKEVLGTLFLRASRQRPFTAGEIRFCRVAAGASANALKNALLYREVAMEAARHRTTSETLRRVLDCTPDMILGSDSQGIVTEFNRGAEKLTGRTPTHAVGRPVAEVLGDAAPPQAGSEPREPRDVALRRPDGTEVCVSLVDAPLVGTAGEPVGRVWIGRDVTQFRRAERALARTERLSSIGEVVAGVAHELNNPLSGVLGFAQLLEGQLRDSPQCRDLQRIVESARRCQRIVLNLLSFARQHPPEKRTQDLNACVERVLDLKAYHLRSSRIEVLLDLAPDLPPARFDGHQVEQVVLNLLNNAEQAIGQTGAPGKIALRTRRDDGVVRLEVEDDGPGVPAAIRDRVFDPFFTTKEPGQGTGLGLSVSYGIAREHGGDLCLASSPEDPGARFVLSLPVAPDGDADPAGDAREPGRLSDLLRGRRILVAEDEPAVLDLVSRVLRQEGAEVVSARDGLEAWECLTATDYDLVLADMRMPNLDGQELYEKVASERPDMIRRFIFATGDLVRQETQRFLASVPNRVLTKPLDVEDIRRVVVQALAGTSA